MTFLIIGVAAQVLRVDEPAAGLPEALRRLLLAEAEHVDALFADARGQPREVAVRRHQAEAVEPPAMQQVHRVDHQRDVGGILAGRIGELLLRHDRMSRQRIGPRLRARAGEVAIDPAHAGFADLGDLLEQPVDDLGRGIVGVDEHGQTRRAGFGCHCMSLEMT
jgi:hypothetical protein